MWRTPKKNTIATTSLNTSHHFSQSFSNFDEEDVPHQISQSPQYRNLYRSLHVSNQKAYDYIKEAQRDEKIQRVRETIIEKEKRRLEKNDFENKFRVKTTRNFMKEQIKQNQQQFGRIKVQENEKQLQDFLKIHPQAKQLEQLCRLTEFYLRDYDKVKTNTEYLNKITLIGKHQRVLPNSNNRYSIFKGNQNQLNKQRILAALKNQKMLKNSILMARRNFSFRRKKNFKQIQYVIKEDNDNVIAGYQLEENDEKAEYLSTLRKIFLNFAYLSQFQRIFYQFINTNRLSQLCQFLSPKSQEEQIKTRVNPQVVEKAIQKITMYKKNKILHFEDFRQLIQTLCRKYQQYNVYNVIMEKNSKILQFPIDSLEKKHEKDIENLLTELKMPIIINLLYQKHQEDIVSRYYLPFKTILEIMKNSEIIPQIVSMSKFVYTCLWFKKREEGYKRSEFIKIQIAIGLRLDNSIEGLSRYLQMLYSPKLLK